MHVLETLNLKLTPVALDHKVSENILVPVVLQYYNPFTLLDSLLALLNLFIRLFRPQTIQKGETEKL